MSGTAGNSKGGVLLLVALLLTGCSISVPVTPELACAAPRVTVTPSTATPGASVTVEGEGWEACNDTPNDGTPSAWGALDLAWIQGDTIDDLGATTAVGGSFQHTVTVPFDARPGRAAIRVSASEYSTDVTVSVTAD